MLGFGARGIERLRQVSASAAFAFVAQTKLFGADLFPTNLVDIMWGLSDQTNWTAIDP